MNTEKWHVRLEEDMHQLKIRVGAEIIPRALDFNTF